jgi:hypothetical protein
VNYKFKDNERANSAELLRQAYISQFVHRLSAGDPLIAYN